jgi:hypothetical protein
MKKLIVIFMSLLFFLPAFSDAYEEFPIDKVFNFNQIVDFGYIRITEISGDLKFEVDLETGELWPDADLHYFFFNLPGGLSSVSVAGEDVMSWTFQYSNPDASPEEGFRASGSGLYDVLVEFGSGANPTISRTEFTLSAEGYDLTIDDIKNQESEGGNPSIGDFPMALHIQNTEWYPDGYTEPLISVWAADSIAVPIPGAVILLGSGFLALLGIRRKLSI